MARSATAFQTELDELERTEQFSDAIRQIETRLTESEDSDEFRFNLFLRWSRALERLRQYEEALAIYSKAEIEFGEQLAICTGQARCFEVLARHKPLLTITRRLLKLEQNPSQVALLHTRMGNLLIEVDGNETGATEHYRQALAYAPGYEPPFHGLLVIAEKRKDWPMVIEVLRQRERFEARS